jgi:hypothetical protein
MSNRLMDCSFRCAAWTCAKRQNVGLRLPADGLQYVETSPRAFGQGCVPVLTVRCEVPTRDWPLILAGDLICSGRRATRSTRYIVENAQTRQERSELVRVHHKVPILVSGFSTRPTSPVGIRSGG